MHHSLVIFGASGDHTSRKLIPALYSLHVKGRLPSQTRIVGVSRTKYTPEAWRQELATTTQKFADKEFNTTAWQTFASNLFYHPGDIDKRDDFVALTRLLGQLEGGVSSTRVYYLATAPSLYATAIANLGAA